METKALNDAAQKDSRNARIAKEFVYPTKENFDCIEQ